MAMVPTGDTLVGTVESWHHPSETAGHPPGSLTATHQCQILSPIWGGWEGLVSSHWRQLGGWHYPPSIRHCHPPCHLPRMATGLVSPPWRWPRAGITQPGSDTVIHTATHPVTHPEWL